MRLKTFLDSFLFDAAEEGGAGGGGSGNLLDDGAGAVGDKGTPPPKDVTGGAPAGDKGTPPNDWRTALPKDLQENPSLKKFTSLDALAGAYVSAQKMIGADKIVVPTEHTTEEEWGQIYRKLGVPEKVEEYGVKFKENTGIDADFSKAFIENAHKLGVRPQQAQALADWFSEENLKAISKVDADAKAAFDKTTNALKAHWGNSFELNLNRARKVMHEHGGADMVKHFGDLGLGRDEQVMKFLAKVGEVMYKEHQFVDGQNTNRTMDPKTLDAEIASRMSNKAYYDKAHPSHKVIVQEVQDLYAQRYPQKA